MLEGVVEDEVNHRMMDFVDEHPEHQPLELLTEDWFVDGVFKIHKRREPLDRCSAKISSCPRRCVITAPNVRHHPKGGIVMADPFTPHA